VTIIATGLPTVESASYQDDGIARLLHDALNDGSEVDLPAFLRPRSRAV